MPNQSIRTFVKPAKLRIVVGITILALFFLAVILGQFIAPYDYRANTKSQPAAPPSRIHFVDATGNFHLRPFMYSIKLVDPLERRYEEQSAHAYSIVLLNRASSYKFLGLFDTNIHLFGVDSNSEPNAPRINLLGTDDGGRDRLSRLLAASRFSLTVSPIGALFASVLGILLGCIAGYGSKFVDALLMRTADAMMALPSLLLILAARAAFPLELSPFNAAKLVILIFVAVGWAEMARLTRGLVMSIKEREFVTAANSLGARGSRILFRHVLPNAMRPILVQFLLMLPAFLLTETALSFLGVGVQEPEPSWGNMLKDASILSQLREHPFLLLTPAFCIFLFVLGVRLLGSAVSDRGDNIKG